MKEGQNMLGNACILYVEDDKDVCNLMRQKLGRIVGEVLVAENGQQGLELYQQHRPDLVVSDLKMPGMDGLSMARAIKSIDHDTPVILTTASNETETLLKAIETGVDGYVIKPIRFNLLVDTMSRCASTLYYRREIERKNKELQELYANDMDDLAVANSIMTHIMRSDGLRDPQIRYLQRPARNFSGDMIACARDNLGDLRILLADVTGHGLQAALFLLPISRAFYSMVEKGFDTRTIVTELNKTMRDLAVPGRFVAAAVAHIADTSIEVWNGGIPSVIYVQESGELHKFRSQHLPLGVLKVEAFESDPEVFHAGPGALFLCSDGLTEAENAAGDLFGPERLQHILTAQPADKLFDSVIAALENHLQGAIIRDDLSIMLAICGQQGELFDHLQH
jgi:two-component system, HptB-dependent secretion and biofilm response regulator